MIVCSCARISNREIHAAAKSIKKKAPPRTFVPPTATSGNNRDAATAARSLNKSSSKLSGSLVMKGSKKVIEYLNRSLASELRAIDQYWRTTDC